MHSVSVYLNKNEYQILKNFSLKNNISMSYAIKKAFLEKLEDEFDIISFNKAYEEFLKDPQMLSLDEINKNLKKNLG